MISYERLIKETTRKDMSLIPGSGLRDTEPLWLPFDAALKPGVDTILDYVGFEVTGRR